MWRSERRVVNKRIFYTKPSITELEIKYTADAATNGWGENCYDYIIRFENAFREHLDVKYAIATSSCTGALHMGLAALGIGPGDEVILADTNWIATAAPIVHLGAKPVFVDILSDTWCIDPKRVEEAITKNTKAIIVTHLYGNLCEMNQLMSIGEKYNIPIIEDAAEAIGSIYHGQRAGSMGKFGTFSFHGSKTITTGEGGMFVTNDSGLFEKVLTLSNHGRRRGQAKQFWPEDIGFKYKISNLQAAIGCAQLERSEELIGRKREILNFYRLTLENSGVIELNPIQEDTQNGAWMPNAVFHPSLNFKIEKVYQAFKLDGIDARPFFQPLSSTNLFGLPRFKNLIAYDIPRRSINLPSYHDIQDSELDRISNMILKLL
jgi:perosamine synthetase